MKIYRFLIIFLITLSFQSIRAQDGSPSPYSFFGLGDPVFTATAENISMGGIHVFSDSLHYNISSPATISRLKYINLRLALKNNFISTKDYSNKDWTSAHNVSYFSLAIPFGHKYAIGFGLLPVNSTGYQIYEKKDIGTYSFEGSGGNNRLFLAGSYRINPNLSVGMEYQYYFGVIKRENLWIPEDVFTFTKENHLLDFSGSTFKFSTFYRYTLNNDRYLNLSLNYRLQTKMDAEYKHVSRLISIINGSQNTEETLLDEDQTGQLTYPSSFNMGAGIGKRNKWFVGAEYSTSPMDDYKNIFYDPDYVQYTQANSLHLGGMFVPQYNSITKYWKRITYRYGIYYKNTGMRLYNEDITDFGITFGVGLPSLKGISNMNLGFEIGKRGKVTDHLIQENYINLHIDVSLNDKWFIKRKIN